MAPSSAVARASSPSSPSTAAARSARELVDRLVRAVGGDAVAGDEEVLRGRAHLAAVERQREREVREHPAVVVGRVDDDGVDAGLLGEDRGLVGVLLQPGAELRRAGVVDDLHLGAQREHLRQALAGLLGRELHEVGREARLGEHVARDRDGDGQRQHGAGVRLHDDRVAGDQAGEQAGVGVPGRERVAADHQRDAARDHGERLGHPLRRPLALRLLPGGLRGVPGHLGVGVGDRLEGAVLRVRSAGLERHRVGLAGGVHHGLRHLVAARVDPVQDLEAELGAGVRSGRRARPGSLPSRRRAACRRRRAGRSMPRSMPYGERSPATSPSVPAWSQRERLAEVARRRRPCRRRGTGCRGRPRRRTP